MWPVAIGTCSELIALRNGRSWIHRVAFVTLIIVDGQEVKFYVSIRELELHCSVETNRSHGYRILTQNEVLGVPEERTTIRCGLEHSVLRSGWQ